MSRGSASRKQEPGSRHKAPKRKPLAGHSTHTRNDPTSRATKTETHRMMRRQRRSSSSWREDAGLDGTTLNEALEGLNVNVEAPRPVRQSEIPVLAYWLSEQGLESSRPVRERQTGYSRLLPDAPFPISAPQIASIWSSQRHPSGAPAITLAPPNAKAAHVPSTMPHPSSSMPMNIISNDQNIWPPLPRNLTKSFDPLRPSPWNKALIPNVRGSSMDDARYRERNLDAWNMTTWKLSEKLDPKTLDRRMPADQLRLRSTPSNADTRTSALDDSFPGNAGALQPQPYSLRWPPSIFGDGATYAAVTR